MTGSGDQPSDEAGGSTASNNSAADAGGGCRVSTAAPPSPSALSLIGLAIGFASARRFRKARPQQL